MVYLFDGDKGFKTGFNLSKYILISISYKAHYNYFISDIELPRKQILAIDYHYYFATYKLVS